MVADLERLVDFYVNGIGMVKTGIFTINEDIGKRSVLTNGVSVWVTVLKPENRPDANEWKLMSFGKKRVILDKNSYRMIQACNILLSK